MHKFKYKFKLPDFQEFESTDKDVSPYFKFYVWVLKQLIPLAHLLYPIDKLGFPVVPGKQFDVNAFWINEEDEAKLKALVYRWIKKEYKLHKKQAVEEVAWHSLEVAPAILLEKDNKKSGYVYIIKDFMRKR